MKKVAFLFLMMTSVVFAQSRKIAFYQGNVQLSDEKYTVLIEDIQAKKDVAKCKVSFSNKTNDILLIDPSECVFKYPFGEFKSTGKMFGFEGGIFSVKPGRTWSFVMEVRGSEKFPDADNFSIIFNGIYTVPSTGKVTAMPDFKLPASSNELKAGPFEIKLEQSRKEKEKTTARFKVLYTGDETALVEEVSVVVKMPDGKEYANYKPSQNTLINRKGEDCYINLDFRCPAEAGDMKTADMFIKFNESFKEAHASKAKSMTGEMKLDAQKTAEKN